MQRFCSYRYSLNMHTVNCGCMYVLVHVHAHVHVLTKKFTCACIYINMYTNINIKMTLNLRAYLQEICLKDTDQIFLFEMIRHRLYSETSDPSMLLNMVNCGMLCYVMLCYGM